MSAGLIHEYLLTLSTNCEKKHRDEMWKIFLENHRMVFWAFDIANMPC